MATEKKWLAQLLKFLPVVIIIGIILITIGIALLCTAKMIYTNEYIIDYTHCKKLGKNMTCFEYKLYNNNEDCICYYYFELPYNLDGEVILYYKLESYNQAESSYVNSRDNKQLSGLLSQEPSENCEPYRYDDTPKGKMPIAPCGAVADAMFNDTFELKLRSPELFVPILTTGMISKADKLAFRNPPGNLTVAFQNFTKPKNWRLNIWELDLDENDPENNGFQNEMFIGWMQTEWDRKPAWRVNHTDVDEFKDGLPKGNYLFRVEYNYPLSRYNGTRQAILHATHSMTYPVKYPIGGLLVAIGLLCVAVTVVLMVLQKLGKVNESTKEDNPETEKVNVENPQKTESAENNRLNSSREIEN